MYAETDKKCVVVLFPLKMFVTVHILEGPSLKVSFLGNKLLTCFNLTKKCEAVRKMLWKKGGNITSTIRKHTLIKHGKAHRETLFINL